VPNTPKDGESNHDSSASNDEQADRSEDVGDAGGSEPQKAAEPVEGEGQHHRFDPDSHWHRPDVSLDPVPNQGGASEWWTSLKFIRIFGKNRTENAAGEGTSEETTKTDPSDVGDDTPWASSSGTSFYLPMPDGTLKQVWGDDFEDAETVQPRLEDAPWHRALIIGGAMGVLGVLAALFFLLNGGEADTQTLDTTAATTQETDPLATDGITTSSSTLAPDTTVSVSSPETTVTDVSVTISDGTYVITVTVAGGGQAMAKSPNTQWYNPRFEVETADGELIIAGGWSPGRDYLGGVQDSDFNAVPGAVVTAEWIGPNTFQTTVSGLGVTGAVVSGTIKIDAGVTNSDGSETNSEAEYTWEN